MIESVFRWDGLSQGDRFECWRDLACSSHAPHEVDSPHKADFRATLQILDLGPATVSALESPVLRARRTQKMIQRSDPELYNLAFTQWGSAGAAQAGGETTVSRGDLLLTTSSQPLHSWLGSGMERTAMVEALLPRAWLPLPAGQADRLLTERLPGQAGVGALLAQFLASLVSDSARVGEPEAERLGSVILELVGALIAHHLGTLPPEAHPVALTMRIRSFINQHLSDPKLSPDVIAAAHHISVRTLHRVFRRQGDTVTSFIRRQRLNGARRDLADATLGTRPIHAIAAAWGFTHPADFTRAFRAAYGMPPSEHRRAAQPCPARRQAPRRRTT